MSERSPPLLAGFILEAENPEIWPSVKRRRPLAFGFLGLTPVQLFCRGTQDEREPLRSLQDVHRPIERGTVLSGHLRRDPLAGDLGQTLRAVDLGPGLREDPLPGRPSADCDYLPLFGPLKSDFSRSSTDGSKSHSRRCASLSGMATRRRTPVAPRSGQSPGAIERERARRPLVLSTCVFSSKQLATALVGPSGAQLTPKGARVAQGGYVAEEWHEFEAQIVSLPI